MSTLKTEDDRPGFVPLIKVRGEPLRIRGRGVMGDRRHLVTVIDVDCGPETTRPPLGSNLEGRITGVENGDRELEVSDRCKCLLSYRWPPGAHSPLE